MEPQDPLNKIGGGRSRVPHLDCFREMRGVTAIHAFIRSHRTRPGCDRASFFKTGKLPRTASAVLRTALHSCPSSRYCQSCYQ